jgi:hypothetical protein
VRDIGASVQVRALIGAGRLRELHGRTFARYECWQCGRPGRTTEPTSVIVLSYRGSRVVKLAHAGCADSRIIEVRAGGDECGGRRSDAPPQRQQARATGRRSRCGETPSTRVPGLKTTRLARTLDLDGSPLRRQSVKIAAPAGAEREVGNDE